MTYPQHFCDDMNCIHNTPHPECPLPDYRDIEWSLRQSISRTVTELSSDELRVIEKLAKKMLDGKQKYGEWKANEEKRNLNNEAAEELIDALNYLTMKLIKVTK